MGWLVSLAGLLAVVLLGAAAGGCHRSSSSAGPDPAAAVIVRPESQGLLLTWIDDKGDFHVETSVADVPMMGRDAVRVVDPNRDESAHPGPGGRGRPAPGRRGRGVPGAHDDARPTSRRMAVARREKAGPTMASAGPALGAARAARRRAPTPRTSKHAAGSVVVVIYGAEWCGACHEAARYLRSKGIPYVDKDVEKDPDAAREMQQKLAKNGLHEGSIPVIDVRGKVMVGFNPAEIDAALGQAL